MNFRQFTVSSLSKWTLVVLALTASSGGFAIQSNETGCDITSGSEGIAYQACTNAIRKKITFTVSANCKNPCTDETWQANSQPAIATGTCGCGATWFERRKTETVPPWNEEFYSSAHSRAWSTTEQRCVNKELAIATAVCSCIGCGNSSPIVISLSDESYQLTSAENGVFFDLNGDGQAEKTAWTAPGSDDGFLVLDRNLNGKIDNFMEVFGNHTPQLPSDEPNGWLALAIWDDQFNGGNEDGVIDAADFIFAELQIWVDRNHNGFSEPSELSSLFDAGLAVLRLEYGDAMFIDKFYNLFKFPSKVNRVGGRSTVAWDIFFARANQLTAEPVGQPAAPRGDKLR